MPLPGSYEDSTTGLRAVRQYESCGSWADPALPISASNRTGSSKWSTPCLPHTGKGRRCAEEGRDRGPGNLLVRCTGAGRRPCRRLSSDAGRDRFHLLPCRKSARRLLRVDELAVEGDLEYTARALHQFDLGVVDPGEPVAHTERFGLVPSSPTVFDPEFHQCFPLPVCVLPAPSIHPGHSMGQLATLRAASMSGKYLFSGAEFMENHSFGLHCQRAISAHDHWYRLQASRSDRE